MSDELIYQAILDAKRNGRPVALATVIRAQGSVPRHAASRAATPISSGWAQTAVSVQTRSPSPTMVQRAYPSACQKTTAKARMVSKCIISRYLQPLGRRPAWGCQQLGLSRTIVFAPYTKTGLTNAHVGWSAPV